MSSLLVSAGKNDFVTCIVTHMNISPGDLSILFIIILVLEHDVLEMVLAPYLLLFSNVFTFDLAMYLLVGIEIPGLVFGKNEFISYG
mgnify:CR=1 FL=1